MIDYDGHATHVKVTRHFDVAPEAVYDAWIQPEIARKWLFTTKTSKTVYELDTQVGGAYTITRRSGGKQYVAVGQYLELSRPVRLAFTFAMPQFGEDVDTIRVEIRPEGHGSTATVTHEGLSPGYERSTAKGWVKMFDLLARALT